MGTSLEFPTRWHFSALEMSSNLCHHICPIGDSAMELENRTQYRPTKCSKQEQNNQPFKRVSTVHICERVSQIVLQTGVPFCTTGCSIFYKPAGYVWHTMTRGSDTLIRYDASPVFFSDFLLNRKTYWRCLTASSSSPCPGLVPFTCSWHSIPLSPCAHPPSFAAIARGRLRPSGTSQATFGCDLLVLLDS